MYSHAAADKRPSRIQAIELLRIIAAFGIVAYHARAPFHDVAYSGLIIFLVLSPMVDLQLNWEKRRPIRSLARSLLTPWAFWMVVYGLFNCVRHEPILPDGWPSVLNGTSAHLWFLPFMFCVLAILNNVKPHFPEALFWICLATVAALLVSASVWRPASLTLPVPLPQWIHAVTPVLAGIALGLMGRVRNGRIVSLVVLGAGLVVADLAVVPGIGVPYTLGIVSVAAVAVYGSRMLPPHWSVQSIASCMMGVYLCHALVLKIVSAVTGKGNYLTVLLTFTLATCGVWVARRAFPISKLVLG
jgi:surface polysaccharide O-acyltransferase-like enzyme